MSLKSKLKHFLPRPIKNVLKQTYWFVVDTFDAIGGRDKLTPPKSMIFVGDGDYKEIGLEFKKYFIDLAELKPNEKILEVGCGIGRMAVPLTNYISPAGEYHGFDIVKKGIDWCQKKITSRFPNFHFLHSDIQNDFYNSNGKLQAKNYKFPFKDNYFDFVFLTSVFTHMLPDDIENYLSEISRVLKIKGRCLITFFLLNNESNYCIQKGISTQNFNYNAGGYLTIDKNNPESAVAYNEDLIINLFKKYNLLISSSIKYGSWCGRQKFLSYQDILVAEKSA